MLKDLNITLFQADLVWENPTANLANFEEKIAQIPQPTDLMVLPEMFNTGFSMNFTETMNLTTHKWMKQMAAQYLSCICGSLAITEKNKKYNRLLFVNTKAETQYYDKKHLFGLGDEHLNFTAGTSKSVMNINGWKILPLICYDLRFPVWSRNLNSEYDILIYVASWPIARIDAWKTLLKARAIENQCYVIGVNRVGVDGNNLNYNGQSVVIDFAGNTLLDLGESECVSSINLDYNLLLKFRKNLPFLSDADTFNLE